MHTFDNGMKRRRLKVVKYLLTECKADVGITDKKLQNSIHVASIYPDGFDVLELLLDNGGAKEEIINALDSEGNTPLDCAHQRKNIMVTPQTWWTQQL